MKVYFIDETNSSRHENFPFYVYGGIVVDHKDLKNISQTVFAEKQRFKIKPERPIKWPNINWNNEGALDSKLHADIKSNLLRIFAHSSCKIILILTPQRFFHTEKTVGSEIKSTIDFGKFTVEQSYAMNLCLEKFNDFLSYYEELGLVFADDFSSGMQAYMKKHCFSLFPSGTSKSSLEKIIYPVIQMDNEYSQVHQINDVVLGAISHSLQGGKFNFLPSLRRNFWSLSDEPITILEKGFNVYPRNVRSAGLRFSINRLNDKFLDMISRK